MRTMQKVDVVCLGELLVDMFPAEIGRRLVEVSAFRPKPGGAPANVAVGLARLGIRSAFIGKVGDDAFGHHLTAIMRDNGVETRGMRFDHYARTTMAFIANPDPDTAEFVFYRNPGADMLLAPDELDWEMLADSTMFHFGSLSLVNDPIRKAVGEAVDLVRRSGGMISLDVNYRPTLWESAREAFDAVWDILASIDLVKVNEEELELLTGTADLDAGSRVLIDAGPEVCVVTLGSRGSYFRISQGAEFVPAYQVKTVDATGCGDGFVAGLLSRLLAERQRFDEPDVQQMKENLLYANAVGALTSLTQGVIPALPTFQQVEDFITHQSK